MAHQGDAEVFQVLVGQLPTIERSTPSAAKFSAYCGRPRPPSHSAISIALPRNPGRPSRKATDQSSVDHFTGALATQALILPFAPSAFARRTFIAALGSAATTWPFAARADQRIPRIGYLSQLPAEVIKPWTLRRRGEITASISLVVIASSDRRWGDFDGSNGAAVKSRGALRRLASLRIHMKNQSRRKKVGGKARKTR